MSELESTPEMGTEVTMSDFSEGESITEEPSLVATEEESVKEEETNEEDSINEVTSEAEGIHTVDTMDTLEQEALISLCDDETSIDQQVSKIFDIQPRKNTLPPTVSQPSGKFCRIRNHVQKVNEEMLATLFETDQRHKAAVKNLKEQLEAQSERNEALQYKVQTLLAHEQENVILVKRAGEKIKKLEATEENNKNYVKLAGERIAALESQEKEKLRQATEKLKVMEAREEKVMGLAKKAAIKIKDLESCKKAQTANSKKAVESIQKLKQMLLVKQDSLEAVRDNALVEFGELVVELTKVNMQCAELQTLLAEAKRQYKDEHELRKGDQKKISALRKMIEQYDGDIETNWSDLSQVLSEEENTTPMLTYSANCVKNQEEFEELSERILGMIPEVAKKNYRQVGFFNTNDYHFPVLALGPFDVPPGPLRETWLEKASTSLGVYYYGQEDVAMAYDMIPAASFIPYEEGVAKSFHIIPTNIVEKIMEGSELSPLEKVFEAGVKRVNAQARSAPDERLHPLKNFEEEFGDEGRQGDGADRSEEFRAKFKKAIGESDSRAELEAELEQIQEEELLDVVSKKQKSRAKPKKTVLSIDVDCDDASLVSAATAPSVDAETMTSLEEQMLSFMHELVVTNKKTFVRKVAAPVALEKCPEETREAADISTRFAEVDETRDDVADGKPSSSLVQERLKMFSSQHAKAAPKLTVVPDSSTKDLMKMWKMKVAGNVDNTTPKQNNTGTSFDFEQAKTNSVHADQQKSGSTRCVTIPKNILKKIEAGEILSDHEREILQGIQKFNHAKAAPSNSHGRVDEEVIVEQMSTVSCVTTEGCNADEKQAALEVSAE